MKEFQFYNYIYPRAKDKRNPRHESRKVILNKAHNSRLTNSRNILGFLSIN